jgi:hypothetical protein
MPKSTTQQRKLWQEFECREAAMVLIPFGPDKIRVAPPAAQAFGALASVLLHHRYDIRTEDTDSYNCRQITNGTGRSLHSYGIALDVNWTTNPFIDHGDSRLVRFSDKETQAQRALDVRFGRADTDMTPEMIADVERIGTVGGVQVFEWGGRWRTRKDCMHFEIDVSPDELAAGIDASTVVGRGLRPPAPPLVLAPEPTPLVVPAVSVPHVVIARDGLRLRSGASAQADIIRVLPHGTRVSVIGGEGEWALVDLQGDGKADGFMSRSFLRPIPVEAGVPPATAIGATAQPLAVPSAARPTAAPSIVPALVLADVTGLVTADAAAQMFPATPKANVAANLPFVLAGLRSRALGDKAMILMALATIRAETEGFVPIDEGRSRFNTRTEPFDLYEPGTAAGERLGNTQPGDGARFKGRGYVQLTGRFNYGRIAKQIDIDLIADPAAANEPAIAGVILAQFLKNSESAVRDALARNDLEAARKLVNGGSHGFDRFRDAFERGAAVLPA